jgi:hypothetical protein
MAKHELNFLELLQSLRRGELIAQADDKLTQVITAMRETGGNGTLTIKMPFKMNKAGQIECTPEVAAKIPTKPIGTGIFYASDDGKLSRRDPNQMDIEDEIDRRRLSAGDVN